MPKVDRLYAFIMQDGETENDEGIIAMRLTPPNQEPFWTPLIGADMSRVKDLTQIADDIARTKGKTYKIVEFHKVSEVIRQPDATTAGGKPDEDKQELETNSEVSG